MPETVRVHVNSRRCYLLGSLVGFCALVVLGLVAIPIRYGIFDALLAVGLAIGLFFAWFSFSFLALALKRPVALRMDQKGISGYYTNPATWDEIKEVRTFSGGRGHKFLGFELQDPVAFRERQTALQRFRSWSFGRQNKVHLVVPEIVLAKVTVEEIADIARDFMTSAKL
ncbi:MAG: hypothetical protein HKN30_18015 [Sulfitobacter sp.]|nr:hypothetical protein [Sulfitobacter sp.]